MTNDELQKQLEGMLSEGTFDDKTIVLLQDASLHMTMLRGISLENAAMAYAVSAMLHEMLRMVVGPELAKSLHSDPEPEMNAAEKDNLNSILKDIHIDL